jgi:hypothetical protein
MPESYHFFRISTISCEEPIWFNTPELAPAQIRQRLQKFGIKPDGIINYTAPFCQHKKIKYLRWIPAIILTMQPEAQPLAARF